MFRSCMLATVQFGGKPVSRAFLIFSTPLYFGLAHLHHAREGYIQAGRTRQAWQRATLTAAIQFAYTTVYGWYANFLFVRTRSVLAPLAAHIVCNAMGLPHMPHTPGRLGTVLYSQALTLHLLGATGFAYGVQHFPVY